MTGIKPATIFALISVTFPGAAWMHAQDRMRAGLWEVTSSINGKSHLSDFPWRSMDARTRPDARRTLGSHVQHQRKAKRNLRQHVLHTRHGGIRQPARECDP